MPITRMLALALVVLSLGAVAVPGTVQAAPAQAPAATQVAAIDLGGLFGDENEADENESDENEGGPPAQTSQQSSGTSFAGLLLAVGLGVVATIFLTRWYFRLRSWVRQLRGRAV